jgi:hypothetical protein
MRPLLSCPLLLFLCPCLLANDALDLARAFFGPPEKLQSVNSIYYEGKIINPSGEGSGTFGLYLKKPFFQRMEIHVGDVITVTAVNGSEGYRQQSNMITGKGRLGILHPAQVEKIIVNTVENLYFLKGFEIRNGRIGFQGKADFKGQACYKLKFFYRANLFYERFVELETGKVLATRDERGITVYQRGEISSGGIRFSRSVESYKGDKHLNTIHFKKILINSPMKDEIFDFPKQ